MDARLLCFVATAILLVAAVESPAGDDDVTARNPLAPPLISIDPSSPEVLDGPLLAADILSPREPNLPEVVVPADGMSLVDANDDLDALSFGPWEGCTMTEFVLIFSVDRDTVGAVAPDQGLVDMGYPFNVQDQALANQAAGDAFMSLLLFTRMGPIPPPGRSSYANNNTLVMNQGDAGGVGFGLSPQGESPGNPQPPGAGQSDADAGSGTQPSSSLGGRPGPEQVLFSLTADSPSLAVLPGYGSGADIYVDHQPYDGGEGEELYVAPFELGLVELDDIDAMLVIDVAYDWQFNPGVDQIIFSLAPGSPSLVETGYGPADLFTSSGNGVFALYCFAEQLGLEPTDNLNLLDYVPCDDVLPCVYEWAIGYICAGDVDHDGDVDLSDLAILLSSYGLCEGDDGFVAEADLDNDGCVDLADLATLLSHYGTVCW